MVRSALGVIARKWTALLASRLPKEMKPESDKLQELLEKEQDVVQVSRRIRNEIRAAALIRDINATLPPHLHRGS